LDGEESVGVLFFSEAFEKDGEVVMVIKFVNVNVIDPLKLASRSRMLDHNWEISSVIISSKV